ncbi:PAS and ANTAR domain-containing protein [Nocardia sp. NPDC059177]|uniref:PAS and ANTAR domain-containing protein n=1 Tax=Nocardia sp. NPDC059177 TaxID=3346759 RepID=UPI0036A899D6
MDETDDASTSERALVDRLIGSGESLAVGRFRYWFAARRWEWSDEVARMHGHPPGTVPTTEMLVAHKHPDDRDRVAAMITSIDRVGTFSSHHRIIDTRGRSRDVLVVSEPMRDRDGSAIGTEGYYIDVSGSAAEYRREAIDNALPDLLAARAVIEQAKGALMLAYAITADQAFRVLRWRSQDTNVKLRVIAERVMAALPAVAGGDVTLRTRLDHVLLTAHEGIPPDPDG